MTEAGFGVPDVPTWSQLVSTGELARTLTRACWLVRDRCELGYRLTVSDGHCVVTILVDGNQHVHAITPDDDSTFETLETVIAAINEALTAGGRGERFAIVKQPGPLHQRHRIVVRDDAQLAIAPLDARVTNRFDGDGSMLGLVADYVERLCRYANLPNHTCKPRWVQDEGLLTFTFDHKRPEGGGSSRTLRVRATPELDVQTILDMINGELDETDTRLYRIAREPDRVDVALLDKATAAELRRAGDLIERPARETIRVLANAGFELPSLYGEWRHWGGFRLRTELARIGMLAKGIAEITCEIAMTGGETDDVDDEVHTLTWTIDGVRTVATYGPELAKRPAAHVLGMICGDLNRALAAAGIAHRCVVMTGEPHFYGYRMLVLDRDWLARVARSQEVLPGCLDEAMLAAIDHVLGMYPTEEPATEPPRLPRMDEIVDRADIRDDDFKCSSRPSDFFDVIESLARFARVAIEVGTRATHEGDLCAIDVTYRGETSTIRVENTKYLPVGPILDYLNKLLDTRKPRRQLYRYRAGGWSGGVVRVTDEQAEKLRALGYI